MCHVTTDRSKIRYESFYLLFLQPLLHPKPSLVYLTPLKRIIHRIDRRQYVSPIDTISNARIGGKAEISGKGKSRIKAKQLDKVKSSCEKKKKKTTQRKKKETVHYIIDSGSSIFHGPEALLSPESIVATYRSIYCQSGGTSQCLEVFNAMVSSRGTVIGSMNRRETGFLPVTLINDFPAAQLYSIR